MSQPERKGNEREQHQTTEEVEDELRELVLLRTRHGPPDFNVFSEPSCEELLSGFQCFGGPQATNRARAEGTTITVCTNISFHLLPSNGRLLVMSVEALS